MNVNDGMVAVSVWLAVASLSVSLVALWVSVDDNRYATRHVLAWMREQEQINRLLRMRVEQLEKANGATQSIAAVAGGEKQRGQRGERNYRVMLESSTV